MIDKDIVVTSMELEESDSKTSSGVVTIKTNSLDKGRVRVKKRTLQVVLEQCQRAIELLNTPDCHDDDDDDERDVRESQVSVAADEHNPQDVSSLQADEEAEELCDLLKSRVECPDFLKKLEIAQASVTHNISEEGNSWDMVSENDLWETENSCSDEEDYVFVRQEDIVEGIACFMAAYLLSLKQTKDLTPNQLQEALSKTFAVKKKKGKLRKAWDGSKVVYNVASWGATAIGIYQNPVIIRIATKTFWTSCRIISKLL